MTELDHNQDLDKLLDSALAEYSSVEPRPGLETRILANVRAASKTASLPWKWRWLWAGTAAALAILLMVLFAGRRSVAPAPGDNVVQKKLPAEQPNPGTGKSSPRRTPEVSGPAPSDQENRVAAQRKMRGRPHPETVALKLEPRRAVFPTPAPLSEQEKLLLSYYAQTPREELIAQSRPEEPPVTLDDRSNIAVPELILVPQKSSNTR